MATSEHEKALVSIYGFGRDCWVTRASVPGNVQTPRAQEPEVPCTGAVCLTWHLKVGPSHAAPRALLSDSQPNASTSQAAGYPVGKI